jgi:sulfur-carrier protein
MQSLAGGQTRVAVEGGTVREVIGELDRAFPGFSDRLCTGEGGLKPGIAVAVDGEVRAEGLRARVGPHSEVHFLPALSGG